MGFRCKSPPWQPASRVTVTVLLAARSRLHRFVRAVLTEDELQDALILAGATLVVLPLIPDRQMGPYGALNPHSIWILVILVMAISAAGYVAVRILGARFGLPIAGLASGFISSTATIGAMGARVRKTTDVLAAAVAGAVLSTVATIVQMAIVLAATDVTTLRALSVPLICAGLAAVVYGTAFTVWALQQKSESEAQSGRAFSLSTASSIRLDSFRHPRRFRGAPRMVWGDRHYHGRRPRRLRRHTFSRNFGRFARRIGKDECS